MRNIDEPGTPDPQIVAEAERFYDLLVALMRRNSMRDPVSAMCEEAQFTTPQVHAVLALGHDVALTMGELARRVGVTEKTITGIVDRLEAHGHLERERDPGDRRVVRARLTAAGAEVFTQLASHLRRKIAVILGCLEADDRRDLYRILEKLGARCDAAGVVPAPQRLA